MAKDEGRENGWVCKAHSGVMVRITIGGTIISVLIVVVGALLGFMWAEIKGVGAKQETANKQLLSKIECLATTKELDIIRDKVHEMDQEIDRINRARYGAVLGEYEKKLREWKPK